MRARYARALAEIPLPVRSFAGIDPCALTVLGETEIADRRLRFGVLVGTPRLWIALAESDSGVSPEGSVALSVPSVLGYLTGLDSGAPELHITELDELDWSRKPGRAAQIKREAMTVWRSAQRECEG
ncbi:hypothetical protein [Glycomyces sp. NRRL B-16210]|uniref:hypothetical protein n=1 Tax=Glycomyces sp. NRRL B-16210 TaxID=1463821 RepID=UPI0004C212DD|nr:hypothetical protein [Glycomyces sp. NRRL B-16210]